MRVLGVDPALRVTGYGVVELRDRRVILVEAGVISPRAKDSLEKRLRALHDGMVEVLAATQPDVVVIEELYATYKNPLTAILMGHARGVLCLAGAQAGTPVQTMAHAHVKRALVGSGNASKDQVNAMVMRLLALRKSPSPNDVSDALAIALAYINLTERTSHAVLNGPRPARRVRV
jgi:crossover junction endodeoxyribonuclease RuvC